jgi:hypothetical protein
LQDNYEYELYRLSTALYPDCPSAGLEWLRFGRVLGSDTTTRNETGSLVRYSDSAVGYIDLAPNELSSSVMQIFHIGRDGSAVTRGQPPMLQTVCVTMLMSLLWHRQLVRMRSSVFVT